MAETHPAKRLRQDDDGDEQDNKKQHHHQEEEEEPKPQPQQESNHPHSLDPKPHNPNIQNDQIALPVAADPPEEIDQGLKSVIRHLLEASDDELGLPIRVDDGKNEQVMDSDENWGFDYEVWEWEVKDDEGGSYYSPLQSDLFMK